MDELFNRLCELSLDPFALERARADGSELLLRQQLAQLVEAERAIAGGDFAACYACSEPGSDPPPFGRNAVGTAPSA
jgi:hypothetical protein